MRITTLACLTLLAGCASTSPIREIGPDTYLVSHEQAGRMSSWETMKGKVYDAAGAHCAKQGKVMQEIGVETSGARGWTPTTAELRFKCVAKP